MRGAWIAVLLLVAAAQADAQVLLKVRIKNVQTGEYLTAQGDTASIRWDHQPVRLAPRSTSNPASQSWNIEEVPGQPGRYFFWHAPAGRVLDVRASSKLASTHPRIAGAQVGQVWDIGFDNTFRAGASGCLDAHYANWRYGPDVGAWPCHGGDNQRWFVELDD